MFILSFCPYLLQAGHELFRTGTPLVALGVVLVFSLPVSLPLFCLSVPCWYSATWHQRWLWVPVLCFIPAKVGEAKLRCTERLVCPDTVLSAFRASSFHPFRKRLRQVPSLTPWPWWGPVGPQRAPCAQLELPSVGLSSHCALSPLGFQFICRLRAF